MGTAKADHKAIDTDIHLETDNGNLIKIDSDSWFQWLGENASFKFTAGFGGEDSYRARKEVLGGVVYWYAFKKVNGKLHKRYIGKPHEVTHNRLCEVAKSIRDVKVKPAKEDKINNDSNQIVNTNLQEIVNQLVNQVQELSNRLDNLENKGDNTNEKKPECLPNEELEVKLVELTNELDSKNSKLSELTNELDSKNSKLVELTNELDKITNRVNELTNIVDNRNSELVQLREENKQLTTTIEGLTNQVTELTNTVDNRDKQLEELRTECDRHLTQINQLTADNQSLIQQFNQSPVPNEQLLTLRENFLEVFRKSIKKGAGDERVIKMGELFDKAIRAA
ncbi:MAG: coiled-coil domain-containing protein [Dolichospermum sp.]